MMNTLPNDIIGIIYNFLSYEQTLTLEKSKILPKEFYRGTNKDYKIRKMKNEIKINKQLLQHYKKHPLIKQCHGSNCCKVDVLSNTNNITSIQHKLSTCGCTNGHFYCEECHPFAINCTMCRHPAVRGCRNCQLFTCEICNHSLCDNCIGNITPRCSGCNCLMCENCIAFYRGNNEFVCVNCQFVN